MRYRIHGYLGRQKTKLTLFFFSRFFYFFIEIADNWLSPIAISLCRTLLSKAPVACTRCCWGRSKLARFVNESECFFLPKRAILAFILKDFYEIDADEREAISSWLRFSIEQKMTRGCSITIAKGNKLIARNYELTVACSFTLIMKGPPSTS